MLPEPIQRCIDEFARLPGIGPKTAARLVFYLLRTRDSGYSLKLSESLVDLISKTDTCPECFNMMDAGAERCGICSSTDRDRTLICVVEEPLDVPALERTSGFQGLYHVLHGALSPVEGVTPDDLRIQELLDRVKAGEVKEIIIATNPSMQVHACRISFHAGVSGNDYFFHLTCFDPIEQFLNSQIIGCDTLYWR